METKSGYITIIGKPNAGKSTLMNSLLGEKLSIITNKPQTTRKRILGILSGDDYQIIFLDTPGILDPNYLLQERMMDYVVQSIKDADAVLLMIDGVEDKDGSRTLKDEKVKEIVERYSSKMIVVINKIDLLKETDIAKIENNYKDKFSVPVIALSALSGVNTHVVMEAIKERLPVHPKFYPDDQLAEDNERFFVSEIIREKIFESFSDEIPYSCEVGIEEFHEREDRKDYISAIIYVERESQKPIIIGKSGGKIKKIGEQARISIEKFLARPVYLELRVKVREKWRSDDKQLKKFGYYLDNE